VSERLRPQQRSAPIDAPRNVTPVIPDDDLEVAALRSPPSFRQVGWGSFISNAFYLRIGILYGHCRRLASLCAARVSGIRGFRAIRHGV
jgi:hypothetical protein